MLLHHHMTKKSKGVALVVPREGMRRGGRSSSNRGNVLFLLEVQGWQPN